MKTYTNVVLLIIILSLMITGCGTPQEGTPPVYGPTLSELSGLDTSMYDVSILPAQSFVVPGEVVAIGLGATVSALKQVANGSPGTFIYATQGMKDILFAWPIGANNYGFVSVSRNGNIVQSMATGNQTSALSMANLATNLEAKGWRTATPADLPTPIFLALQSARSWLMGLASLNPVLPIFIIPADAFEGTAPLPPM